MSILTEWCSAVLSCPRLRKRLLIVTRGQADEALPDHPYQRWDPEQALEGEPRVLWTEEKQGGGDDDVRMDPALENGGHLLLDLSQASHGKLKGGGAGGHDAGLPVVGVRSVGEMLADGRNVD
jgi:hypothetical protein